MEDGGACLCCKAVGLGTRPGRRGVPAEDKCGPICGERGRGPGRRGGACPGQVLDYLR